MENPIYIEYYSHEKCDCYKIDLPYSNYNKDVRVLCKVSEGIEVAKHLAMNVLIGNINEVIMLPVKNKED